MSAQQSFETLKSFFETRNAARQALRAIDERVEIGLIIGGQVECALFRQGEQPVVEQRPAKSPDVVFHILPESVEVLNARTKDEIGDIGIAIIKEVLAGNIKIKVPGRLMNILTRGYIGMIRQGGAPVMGFLAKNGFGSVPKIIATIKQMKKT